MLTVLWRTMTVGTQTLTAGSRVLMVRLLTVRVGVGPGLRLGRSSGHRCRGERGIGSGSVRDLGAAGGGSCGLA